MYGYELQIDSIFSNNGNLNLDNVTINGGSGDYTYGSSPFINNISGTTTIKNSILNNPYVYGGTNSYGIFAISNQNGTVNIENTQIRNLLTNHPQDNSLIHNDSGTMNITGGTIDSNRFGTDYYTYIYGSVENNRIIYNNSGEMNITSATISNNRILSAENEGYYLDYIQNNSIIFNNTGDLSISAGIITSNQIGGNSIYGYNGSRIISNNNIITNYDGNMTISDTTISSNTIGASSGNLTGTDSSIINNGTGTLTIQDSIIKDNSIYGLFYSNGLIHND